MNKTGRPEILRDSHVRDIQDRLNRGQLHGYIATCYGCNPKTVSRFIRRHHLRRDNTHLNETRDNLKMLTAYSHRYAKRHFKILRAQRFYGVEYEELLSRFNALIPDVLRMFVPGFLKGGQDKPACLRTYFYSACQNAAQDYRQELVDELDDQGFVSEHEIVPPSKKPATYSSQCHDCGVEWSWSWFPLTVRRGECPYCHGTNGRRLMKPRT
ncbi:hypothetical protein EDC59_102198 [Pseudodesulfovibrio indicus]|uniref:Uncharacterized protein n=1 Tax=Pseudodesulfovibrio indicus TaxID=1716143 RepID=A0A126QRY1_9BACT|nr:hypothetical protein AWY79_15835 [Pseudodesulfovibrio indicus]TDT90768.1 hypothetical protein EDC59_102198 [Pseudodesulfovibrio indicus]